MKLNSKLRKVRFLKKLQYGKATIEEILPIEFGDLWLEVETGVYENERTKEKKTEAEMGSKNYWITFD